VRGGFLLCACQPGAEAALAARAQALIPGAARGAWRRGVVTFRLDPAQAALPDDVWPDLIFARAVIHSLGQVAGADPAACAAELRGLVGETAFDTVHVWQRDPRVEVSCDDIRGLAAAACGVALPPAASARPGDLVLDCVVDTPGRWWVGWHRAHTPPSTWPGGVYPGVLGPDKVSRAWLKLDEAIASFRISFTAGERAIELGAAPGGACQRLLEAELDVVGVDPALVDPRVAAQPRFTQWRMRARDVQLRRFQGCDWIVSDMNIDPKSALAAIGRAVTAPGVRPRGIVATLKLPDWSRAAELAGWLDTIREWGYAPEARQLSTAGREVCVVARRDQPAGSVRVSRPARRRPAR
jgi:23S rRNA (cytidine2498-2'-O)-methyltransferase